MILQMGKLGENNKKKKYINNGLWLSNDKKCNGKEDEDIQIFLFLQ